MTALTLGARPVIAGPDTTGMNPGNWTAIFDDNVINVTTPEYELYHMFIQAPSLNLNQQSSAIVRLNSYAWDATLVAQLNSWDPSQPLIMRAGDTLSVAFNVPDTSMPAPKVTCWFRYQQ